MESLYKNQIDKLVRLHTWKKKIGCKYIYKMKKWYLKVRKIKYKTRLVAKEYAQIKKSLVVKITSIQIFLVIIAYYDIELKQLDLITIILYEKTYKRYLYKLSKISLNPLKEKLSVQVKEIIV